MQWRARSVIVVPRHIAEDLVRSPSTRREPATRVVVDDRPRPRAERFREVPHFWESPRGEWIERRFTGQELRALFLRTCVDPLVIDDRAEHHQQRSTGTDGAVERVEDSACAALGAAN